MRALTFVKLLVIFVVALPEGTPLHYAPDKSYHYSYSTQVSFNEPGVNTEHSKAYRDVGLELSTSVLIQPVWYTSNNMLVKLQLSKPRIHGVARHDPPKDLQGLGRYPAFFHWQGSTVGQVYLAAGDPIWAQNIKMGIISLLQLQRDEGKRTEIDASGECNVEYKVNGNQITKLKTGCKNLEIAGQFYNVNPLLSVSKDAVRLTRYEIGDDIIKSVQATENHQVQVNMQEKLASALQAKQEMKLEKTSSAGRVVQASTLDAAVQQISKREKLELSPGLLGTSIENRQCNDNCKATSELVSELRSDLTEYSASSVEYAKAFLKLVNAFRNTKKDDVLSEFRNEENQDIVPVLIDSVVAAQTTPGQDALMEFLDFTEESDITLPERYLLAAAFSTHPSYKLLNDLLEIVKKNVPDERLRESVGEGLGAVVYSYSRTEGQENDKIVGEIEATLLEKLRGCEEDPCRGMLLRALSNAGLPGSIPTILEFAEKSKSAVISEAAVKALRRMDKKYITEEVLDVMRRIYHQRGRGYDSAVRSQALKYILDTELTQADVLELLTSVVGDPESGELQTYVLARLWTEAETDPGLKVKVETALKDTRFRNWDIMAPGGKALAFKENLAEAGGVTATYDMYTENSKAHIMKRSGMDVDVISSQQTLPLYSFGLFAAGLEGLLGEEVEEGQEDADPTAGLALNLIDVALRPVTFFVGQSGLMSAVWSAPSELVSAFQANLLLQDHSERLHLQNGLVVEVNVQGVVSMDLSGMISISLWNKNCNSLIKNSGALLVEGSMSINTAAFQSGLEFSSEAASVIDFATTVDFYDKLKMCLQMSRPGVNYRQSVRKYEKAQGFKNSYIANIRRKRNIPEVSYPLPKPNNNQCRVLLAEGS